MWADRETRLNKYVREQAQWTSAEIEARGKSLAAKCLTIWPSFSVSPQLLQEARAEVLRKKASTVATSQISMTEAVHPIFKKLQESISALGGDIIEVPHKASISYHTPEFLLEAIPRARRITLILPIDFAVIVDPPDIAGDATDWKFFVNAQYSGGTYISLRSLEDVVTALPIITKVYSALRLRDEILPAQA
jgi:predicted transport protein